MSTFGELTTSHSYSISLLEYVLPYLYPSIDKDSKSFGHHTSLFNITHVTKKTTFKWFKHQL